jgi:hypothetical protein
MHGPQSARGAPSTQIPTLSNFQEQREHESIHAPNSSNAEWANFAYIFLIQPTQKRLEN